MNVIQKDILEWWYKSHGRGTTTKFKIFTNHLGAFGVPLDFLYFPKNTMCFGVVAKYRNGYERKK